MQEEKRVHHSDTPLDEQELPVFSSEDSGVENAEDEGSSSLDEDEDEDEDGDMGTLEYKDLDEYGYDDDDDDDDEEEGPLEQEVEEVDHVLGVAPSDVKVKVKVYRQEDDDEFEEWMHTIIIKVTHDGKDIAHGDARYVKRDWIRANFWRDMEEPCVELSNLAFEVFDRYGRLKQELKEHAIRKGTGVFGSELDLGSFFVLEFIHIDEAWRRKGLGTLMTKTLMKKSRSSGRNPAFHLVAPAWLTSDIEKQLKDQTKLAKRDIQFHAKDIATNFYRSIGFRRIGASTYFCLTEDSTHKAHSVPSHEDFDPIPADADEDVRVEDVDQWFIGESKLHPRRLERLKERLPLHHATITLDDDELVKFYEIFKDSRGSQQDWSKVDYFRNNVLHLAAIEAKTKSVQWLLANMEISNALNTARNAAGYLPVEALQNELENKRTTVESGMLTVVISDGFQGFSPKAVSCLATFENAPITSTRLLQLTYGCTCRQCANGLLSPRMKFALLCQAEVTHDMLDAEIDDGPSWCMWHDDILTHVAPDILQNFRTNKSLRQGFSNIFNHAARALRKNIVPTVENVRRVWSDESEWPPVTRNFFQRGGTIESALQVLFERAKDQDLWAGDGTHMDVFADQVEQMPQCRNDEEFGFVAVACGMPHLPQGYY